MQDAHKKKCHDILRSLNTNKYQDKVVFFLVPVREVFNDAEWKNYTTEISQPRDLRTIEETLENDGYSSWSAFCKDVELCFENAKKYNQHRHKHVADAATAMLKVFKQLTDKMINSLQKTSAPISSPSAAAVSPPTETVQFSAGEATSILETVTALDASRWFVVPVDTDLPLYTARVPQPIDFPTIQEKIRKRKYQTMDQFALDVRRVFGNTLAYHFSTVDVDPEVRRTSRELRADAKSCLFRFELEWAKRFGASCAPAMDHLKECLQAIDKLLEIKRPGSPAALMISFIDHVKYYYGSEADAFMKRYSKVVKQPMSYGSIIRLLVEAKYKSIDGVIADAKVLADNCAKWFASENGVSVSEAKHQDFITQDAFTLYDKLVKELSRIPRPATAPAAAPAPSKGTSSASSSSASSRQNSSSDHSARKKTTTKKVAAPSIDDNASVEARESPAPAPSSTVKAHKPPNLKDRYLWCLKMLKEHHLVDEKGRKGVQTCWLFNKAVDPLRYPDYPKIITNPMDLNLMEKKVKGERYPNMLLFLSDMKLIRENTYTFNSDAESADVRYLADMTLSNFQYLLREVAREVLGCNSQTFIDKVLPADARDTIMTPHELDEKSASFYAPLIEQQRKPPPPSAPAPVKITRQPSSSSRPVPVPVEEPPEENVYPEVVFPNAGKGKRAGKGKGKRRSSAGSKMELDDYPPEPEPVAQPPPLLARQSSIGTVYEWEQPCVDLLKKLAKHEFLDVTRTSAKVFKADFFHPVVDLFPDIADAYLEVIKSPMDFSIISSRLALHGFMDEQDVYEKIILVFQNSIDFNEPNLSNDDADDTPDDELARKMVVRSKHMLRYTAWLAHEMLPVADDLNDENPEALGFLRMSLRNQYRKERMDIVVNAPLDSNKECFALMKKFENRKFAKDYIFFARPVPSTLSDYSVYVRHPMDFQKVREKLDRELYTTFGQFVKDMRLIFSNGKAYNKVHKDVDEMSNTVYEASIMFEEMLETLLNKEFSIDVAERVMYSQIKNEEEAKLMSARLAQERAVEEELEEFRRQEIERLKSTNAAFAKDQLLREQQAGIKSTAPALSSSSSSVIVRRQSSSAASKTPWQGDEDEEEDSMGRMEGGSERLSLSVKGRNDMPSGQDVEDGEYLPDDEREDAGHAMEGPESPSTQHDAGLSLNALAMIKSAKEAARERVRREAWLMWGGGSAVYTSGEARASDGMRTGEGGDVGVGGDDTATSSQTDLSGNREALSRSGFVVVSGNEKSTVSESLFGKPFALRRKASSKRKILFHHKAFSVSDETAKEEVKGSACSLVQQEQESFSRAKRSWSESCEKSLPDKHDDDDDSDAARIKRSRLDHHDSSGNAPIPGASDEVGGPYLGNGQDDEAQEGFKEAVVKPAEMDISIRDGKVVVKDVFSALLEDPRSIVCLKGTVPLEVPPSCTVSDMDTISFGRSEDDECPGQGDIYVTKYTTCTGESLFRILVPMMMHEEVVDEESDEEERDGDKEEEGEDKGVADGSSSVGGGRKEGNDTQGSASSGEASNEGSRGSVDAPVKTSREISVSSVDSESGVSTGDLSQNTGRSACATPLENDGDGNGRDSVRTVTSESSASISAVTQGGIAVREDGASLAESKVEESATTTTIPMGQLHSSAGPSVRVNAESVDSPHSSSLVKSAGVDAQGPMLLLSHLSNPVTSNTGSNRQQMGSDDRGGLPAASNSQNVSAGQTVATNMMRTDPSGQTVRTSSAPNGVPTTAGNSSASQSRSTSSGQGQAQRHQRMRLQLQHEMMRKQARTRALLQFQGDVKSSQEQRDLKRRRLVGATLKDETMSTLVGEEDKAKRNFEKDMLEKLDLLADRFHIAESNAVVKIANRTCGTVSYHYGNFAPTLATNSRIRPTRGHQIDFIVRALPTPRLMAPMRSIPYQKNLFAMLDIIKRQSCLKIPRVGRDKQGIWSSLQTNGEWSSRIISSDDTDKYCSISVRDISGNSILGGNQTRDESSPFLLTARLPATDPDTDSGEHFRCDYSKITQTMKFISEGLMMSAQSTRVILTGKEEVLTGGEMEHDEDRHENVANKLYLQCFLIIDHRHGPLRVDLKLS